MTDNFVPRCGGIIDARRFLAHDVDLIPEGTTNKYVRRNSMADNEVRTTAKLVPAHTSIISKLYVIQQECPAIYKTADANSGGRKYSWSYAPLTDVLNTIRPLFDKQGLFLYWLFESNTIKVIVRDENSNEFVETYLSWDIEEDFQDVGKRITYYLNRLILGLIGIVAEDDTGGESTATRKRKKSGGKKRSRRNEDEDDEPEDEEDIEEEEEDDDDEDDSRSRRSRSRGNSRRRGRSNSSDDDDDDEDDEGASLPRRTRRRGR